MYLIARCFERGSENQNALSLLNRRLAFELGAGVFIPCLGQLGPFIHEHLQRVCGYGGDGGGTWQVQGVVGCECWFRGLLNVQY